MLFILFDIDSLYMFTCLSYMKNVYEMYCRCCCGTRSAVK